MNDTTKWIMIILLLLLIGAAVFMLLRSPGKDDGDTAVAADVDRDRDGVADRGAEPVAPVETSRTDREVYDQAAVEQTPSGAYAEAPVTDEPDYRDRPLPADDEPDYRDAPLPADDEPDYRDAPLPADDEAAGAPGYAEPVYDEPEADRQERMSRSAEIGALGAAGATGVAAGGTVPTAEETGYAPDAGAHEPDTTYVDETSRPTVTEGVAEERGVADVHPLTDEDVDAGARTEPLTADEVVEHAGPEATVDDRETGTGYAAREYPVGDDATYRAEDGDAVAVEGPATTTGFVESSFGPGSAEPLEDGTGPAGWEVKGNSGSMLFHTPDSPSYDAVRAEVWFENEEAARNAGFAHWDRRRR